MDYDRWLLNQADAYEETKVGYRSNVIIEMVGKTEDVMVVLNTYKMTETPQDIVAANHILETGVYKPEFMVHETDEHIRMVWSFDDVKWYTESANAYDRLAELVDEMTAGETKLDVALYLTRTGEDANDIENGCAGNRDEHDSVAYAYSGINLDMPQDTIADFATFKPKGATVE